jgi:hypothetical protein
MPVPGPGQDRVSGKGRPDGLLVRRRLDRLAREAPSRQIESLTQVDRSGHPDDVVDATEAARMLRYANRHVIHANRRLGYFPEPDAYGKAVRGRPAPLWKRSTVWAAADRRQGMGGGRRPGSPGAPLKPHPYAGDERLTRVLADLRSGIQPSGPVMLRAVITRSWAAATAAW